MIAPFSIEANLILRTAGDMIDAPIASAEDWREAEASPAFYLAVHFGCASSDIEAYAASNGFNCCNGVTKKGKPCAAHKLALSFQEWLIFKKDGWRCPRHAVNESAANRR